MSKEEILNMFTEISAVILLLDKKKVGEDSFEKLQTLVKKMTLLGNRIERGEVGENSDEGKSEQSEEEDVYDKVDVEEDESSEEDEHQYDVVDDKDGNSDTEEEGGPIPLLQTQTSNIGTSAKVMNAKAIHKSFLWMKKGLLKHDERLWSVLTPESLYLYNSASDPVHKALIDPLQGARVAISPGNLKKFIITVIDINGKKSNYTFATDDENKTTEWIKSVNKASNWNLNDNTTKPHKKQKKKPGSRAVSVDVKESAKIKNDELFPQNKTAKEKIYPKPKIKTPYGRANTEMVSNSTKEKLRSRSNTGAIKSPYSKTSQKSNRFNNEQSEIDEYITPMDDNRQSIDDEYITNIDEKSAKEKIYPKRKVKTPYGRANTEMVSNSMKEKPRSRSNTGVIKSPYSKTTIAPMDDKRQSTDDEYITHIDDEETPNQINAGQVYDDTTTLTSDEDEDSDKNTISSHQGEQPKAGMFYDDTTLGSSEESDNQSKGSHLKSEYNPRNSGYEGDLHQEYLNEDQGYTDDEQAYIDDGLPYVDDDQEYPNDDQPYLIDDQEYIDDDYQGYTNADQEYYIKQKPFNTSAKIMKGFAPLPPKPSHDDTHSRKPPPKPNHDNTHSPKPLPPQKPKQRNTQKESSPGSSRPDSQSGIEKLKLKFSQNQEDRISVPSNSHLRKSTENLGPRLNKSAPQSKGKPKKGRSKEPNQFKAPPPNLTFNDELANILAKKKTGAFDNLP